MRARRILVLSLLGLLVTLPRLAAAQSDAPTMPAAPSAEPGKTVSGGPGTPTITYRKIFKGSTPEYVQIQVDRNGAGTYDIRQLDDPPNPQPFQVSAPLTADIFSLAADLHDFNGVQLSVRRLIANLGQKTFRYEGNGETYEASFNYTVNPTADKLMRIFEGLSLEDQYLGELTRSIRYDPLGLNDVLMRLETDLEANAVAEPQALEPVLKKIVANQQLMNIARDRASQILASFGKTH